jgi:hypothetical protein
MTIGAAAEGRVERSDATKNLMRRGLMKTTAWKSSVNWRGPCFLRTQIRNGPGRRRKSLFLHHLQFTCLNAVSEALSEVLGQPNP